MSIDDNELDDKLQAHLVEVLDGVESITNRTITTVRKIVTDVLDGRREDRELIREAISQTKHLMGLAERLLADVARSHGSDPAQGRACPEPAAEALSPPSESPPPYPLGTPVG